MLSDGFGHSVQYTFQIIKFTSVLYFHDNDFILTVSCLYIYPVEFIIRILLISFAFQYIDNGYFLAQEHGEESFQHVEVRFLSQQAFDSPIKTDVFVL